MLRQVSVQLEAVERACDSPRVHVELFAIWLAPTLLAASVQGCAT